MILWTGLTIEPPTIDGGNTQNSEGNVAVLVRLIEVLNIIAGFTYDEERRQALKLRADLVLLLASRPGGDSTGQQASYAHA